MTETTKFSGKQLSLLKRLHNKVVAAQPWSILVTIIILLITIAQFGIDYSDRVRERTTRARMVVPTRASGNSGIKEALEYLNREDGLLCIEFRRKRCFFFRKPRAPLVNIDLSASKKDSRIFLKEVDLVEADLTDAKLDRANLTDAKLHRADLTRACLTNAILDGADLTDAKLHKADLRDASLDGAYLTDASLDGADLIDAKLHKADLIDASLDGAYLTDASLNGADLRGASLNGADLHGASLDGADLTDASLDGADLRNASLNGADLTDASLDGADLRDAKLHSAKLGNAALAKANLAGANFSGALNLSQAQLNKACTSYLNDPPVLPNGLVWKDITCSSSWSSLPPPGPGKCE